MTNGDQRGSAPGTALVTGATGFIGSHLVRRLLREGFSVHVLCRSQSDFWRLRDVLPRVERHPAALEDAGRLREVVSVARPQYIFHLAAATVVAGSAAAATDLVTTNLLGTINLLDACEAVDYRGLVSTGDSFEYSAGGAPLCESDACRPNTLHGITKLAATLYAQAVAAARGRPVVVLRLFSTFGPGDNPCRLVPRVIVGALAGTPLSLSRPDIARDWVYIDDLVDLYLEAARKAPQAAGGVFNVGSGKATNLGEIVETILRLTGSRAEARWGVFPAAEHDAYPWVADMRRTFSAFDWRPATTLQEGLRAMITSAAGCCAP